MNQAFSLPTALCLPSSDITALLQGRIIAALPRMFIRPGQRFALYPAETPGKIKAWAKCELCQILDGTQPLEVLSQLTIWTPENAFVAGEMRNQSSALVLNREEQVNEIHSHFKGFHWRFIRRRSRRSAHRRRVWRWRKLCPSHCRQHRQAKRQRSDSDRSYTALHIMLR